VLGRSASFTYLVLSLYLTYVNERGTAYPWYFPPPSNFSAGSYLSLACLA
jgi:hypothetical protein